MCNSAEFHFYSLQLCCVTLIYFVTVNVSIRALSSTRLNNQEVWVR